VLNLSVRFNAYFGRKVVRSAKYLFDVYVYEYSTLNSRISNFGEVVHNHNRTGATIKVTDGKDKSYSLELDDCFFSPDECKFLAEVNNTGELNALHVYHKDKDNLIDDVYSYEKGQNGKFIKKEFSGKQKNELIDFLRKLSAARKKLASKIGEKPETNLSSIKTPKKIKNIGAKISEFFAKNVR